MEMEGKPQSQSPSITPVTQPTQVQKSTDLAPGGSKKSKNRKARSGLQEMLEKKRKNDQMKKSTGTPLASFLQGL